MSTPSRARHGHPGGGIPARVRPLGGLLMQGIVIGKFPAPTLKIDVLAADPIA